MPSMTACCPAISQVHFSIRRLVRQKDTAMTLKELRSKAFATRKQLELAQHNLRETLFNGSTWGQVWDAEQKVDRALDRMMRACNKYQNARSR
jgi:hypothetical protein